MDWWTVARIQTHTGRYQLHCPYDGTCNITPFRLNLSLHPALLWLLSIPKIHIMKNSGTNYNPVPIEITIMRMTLLEQGLRRVTSLLNQNPVTGSLCSNHWYHLRGTSGWFPEFMHHCAVSQYYLKSLSILREALSQ